MRSLLKHFVIDSITLYLVSQVVSGMIFANGMYTLLLTGATLMLATFLVEPVINILLLPINLITFGFFKWAGYAITLYLVTLVVPGFEITNFVFNGYSSYWLSIPPVMLTGLMAFLAFSLVLSFVSSVISWVFK